MGPSLCKMCFLPCTTRCEPVPWMISIVEVDIDKQSCEGKVLLGRIVLLKITRLVRCYVRYASAVEDTPRRTILITGRSYADSDRWVNPRERARLPMAHSCSG